MRFRLLVAVVLCAMVVAGCSNDAAGEASGPLLPAVAEELPAFDLAAYEQLLVELRGTPVLVNIWASWCEPCRDEAPHLASAHAEFGDRVQFLGIDILDERGSAREFMREYGWRYPSVFDASGAIRDGLGILGQPATLFYDASGELVKTWIGPLTEDALSSGVETILLN
ncbi:MAG TPA: TlpA disulfide reductase family protein [Actinomycetota bacterium]|nr:TlpA disulfide reductase family protein [Actinomycetota bacterium]